MKAPGWLPVAMRHLPAVGLIRLAAGPLPAELECRVCEVLLWTPNFWPERAEAAAVSVARWHSEHQGDSFEDDYVYAIGLEGIVSYWRCLTIYAAAREELARRVLARARAAA